MASRSSVKLNEEARDTRVAAQAKLAEARQARLESDQAASEVAQSRSVQGQASAAFNRQYPAHRRAANRIQTYSTFALGAAVLPFGPIGAAVGLGFLGLSARASARHIERLEQAAPEWAADRRARNRAANDVVDLAAKRTEAVEKGIGATTSSTALDRPAPTVEGSTPAETPGLGLNGKTLG
jgi:hypothetical protein